MNAIACTLDAAFTALVVEGQLGLIIQATPVQFIQVPHEARLSTPTVRAKGDLLSESLLLFHVHFFS